MSDNQYNEFAQCIMNAVTGKLSKESCQQVTNNLHLTHTSTGNTQQMRNLLETLEFNKDKNSKYESVNTWAQRVKQNLQDNKLKNFLEATVQTSNKYSSNLNENVNLEGIKVQETSNNLEDSVAHITSTIDGLNQYQKYMNGLLEKKAADLGIKVQTGGAGLSYDAGKYQESGLWESYVDEEATTKGAQFYTAEVLKGITEEIFKKYDAKGVTLDEDTKDRIIASLDSLGKKEKALKENAAKLEKYLALRKYFPKNPNVPDETAPLATNMKEIEALLTTNKALLENVTKKRESANQLLIALVPAIHGF